MPTSPALAALEDPRFREALVRLVKKRVPAGEVEDIVQTALAEAVLSDHAPKNPDSLRRWIWGVARHKVADFHRRPRAEIVLGSAEAFDRVTDDDVAHTTTEARDWMRWARRELPQTDDAEETLEWMLREGDGERLEEIADEANVPAPRVRQRVSRMRKHLRSRWAREVAALAALGVLMTAVWLVWSRLHQPPQGPSATPETFAPRVQGPALAPIPSPEPSNELPLLAPTSDAPGPSLVPSEKLQPLDSEPEPARVKPNPNRNRSKSDSKPMTPEPASKYQRSKK